METVRAESFRFGRTIANSTEIQLAPSGNQAGIQIEKREMIPSAIKQYAAENAIAPIIRSTRENLRSAPLNAAANTTIAQSKIQLTRRTNEFAWIAPIAAAKTSGALVATRANTRCVRISSSRIAVAAPLSGCWAASNNSLTVTRRLRWTIRGLSNRVPSDRIRIFVPF